MNAIFELLFEILVYMVDIFIVPFEYKTENLPRKTKVFLRILAIILYLGAIYTIAIGVILIDEINKATAVTLIVVGGVVFLILVTLSIITMAKHIKQVKQLLAESNNNKDNEFGNNKNN